MGLEGVRGQAWVRGQGGVWGWGGWWAVGCGVWSGWVCGWWGAGCDVGCGVWDVGCSGAVGCWVLRRGSLGAGLCLVALGEYSRACLVLPGVFLGSGREVLAMGGCFLAGGLTLLRQASLMVARHAGPTPPACSDSHNLVLVHVNLRLRPP